MLLGRTGALAGVAQSSHVNNRPKSEGWFPQAAKRQPTPPGCSRSIRPPSRGYWIGHRPRHQGRPGMPNSAEKTMPNNSESDTAYSARWARRTQQSARGLRRRRSRRAGSAPCDARALPRLREIRAVSPLGVPAARAGGRSRRLGQAPAHVRGRIRRRR